MKILIMALAATISASSLASVPNTFEAGQVATAADFNENFENLDGRVEALENAAGVPQQQQLVTYTPSGLTVGQSVITGSSDHYYNTDKRTYYSQGYELDQDQWSTYHGTVNSQFDLEYFHPEVAYEIYLDGVIIMNGDSDSWNNPLSTYLSSNGITDLAEISRYSQERVEVYYPSGHLIDEPYTLAEAETAIASSDQPYWRVKTISPNHQAVHLIARYYIDGAYFGGSTDWNDYINARRPSNETTFFQYPDGKIYSEQNNVPNPSTEITDDLIDLTSTMPITDYYRVFEMAYDNTHETGFTIAERRLNMPDGSALVIQAPTYLNTTSLNVDYLDWSNPSEVQTIYIGGFEFEIHSHIEIHGDDLKVTYNLLMKVEGGRLYFTIPNSVGGGAELQALDDFIDHIRVSVEPAQ